MRRIPLLVMLALLAAAPALAQTVNPTILEFLPSPDHTAIADGTGPLPAGVPLVARYQLEIALATNLGQFVATRDLGKPDPNQATGKITLPIDSSLLASLPASTYVAAVSAVGEGGLARSDYSDPFVRIGPPRAPGKPALKK